MTLKTNWWAGTVGSRGSLRCTILGSNMTRLKNRERCSRPNHECTKSVFDVVQMLIKWEKKKGKRYKSKRILQEIYCSKIILSTQLFCGSLMVCLQVFEIHESTLCKAFKASPSTAKSLNEYSSIILVMGIQK